MGWFGGGVLIFGLGNVLHGSGRSCPEGWAGISIGVVLLATGLTRIMPRSRIAGCLCAGFGFGSAIVSGGLVFLSRILPSC